VLFIAGLPKSGTTWLEGMIAGFPGYGPVMIPEAVRYELLTGGSHDYDLPADTFNRFREALAVFKLHVHGSSSNVALLHSARLRYIVIYRDLRDVAVSYCFYVRKTPWHPEFSIYSRISVQEGMAHFGRTLLPQYAEWIRSWHRHRDPDLGIEIRYEDLLCNTTQWLTQAAIHFGLHPSEEMVKNIAESNSFKRLSGGRNQGEQRAQSFFRKGIAGDWINHFTPELKKLYKDKIGAFLVELGYEKDVSW
jgi:hypothetical protein